jgi:hypothetical protein
MEESARRRYYKESSQAIPTANNRVTKGRKEGAFTIISSSLTCRIGRILRVQGTLIKCTSEAPNGLRKYNVRNFLEHIIINQDPNYLVIMD